MFFPNAVVENCVDPIFNRQLYLLREHGRKDPLVGVSILEILDRYGHDASGCVVSPSELILSAEHPFRQCDMEFVYSGTGKRQPEPMFIAVKQLKCIGVIRGAIAKSFENDMRPGRF